MSRGVWQHGKNKNIKFFVHFNADSDEFNQLETIVHLFLGSPNVSCHPSISHAPYQSPLQPHPNIHEIPMKNSKDGWNQIPSNHPNGIQE
jgi:hypothetical protein